MTMQNQSPSPLSLERLAQLLDTYGANLAHFPSSEGAQAEALLKDSVPAQKAWAEAKALDTLLGEAEAEAAPSQSLMDALHKIPERNAQKGVLLQFMPKKSRALSSFAAAAALLLGVVTGVQQSESEATYVIQTGSDEYSDDLALSELSELALGTELMSDLGYFEGELE